MRLDNDALAICAQAGLVLTFLAAQTVQLFNNLQAEDPNLPMRVLGLHSMDAVVSLMIACNFAVFVPLLLLIVYQAGVLVANERARVLNEARTTKARCLRFKEGRGEVQPPALMEGFWHVFLSQCANVGTSTARAFRENDWHMRVAICSDGLH